MWKSKRMIPIWLCLGAALTALTLIFPQIGFLEWLSMIPVVAGCFLLCDSAVTLRKSYLYGFLTVFCYYFILYHWIVYLYPLDFVGMDSASSVIVIVVGWIGLTLLQAVPGGLIFLFFRLMYKTGIFDRAPLLKPFVFSSLWVIFEWISTLSFAGVPWGRLYMGQVKLLPMIQISSAFGSYAVSFLLLTVNGLVAYALLYRRKEALCGGLAAGLVVFDLVFGLISMYLPRKDDETVMAAVIQGNINSHDKWGDDGTEKMQKTYADLTRDAADHGAELVIWPETTLPYALNTSENSESYLSSLARECNVTLIVGALYDSDEGEEFNSLFLVLPNGTISKERYDKRHLVPFGEYVPMREIFMTLVPPLVGLSALEDDLTPGADTGLFTTEWGQIGSLICFDSIYEMLGVDSVRDGAELMLISSNDSWFYDSAAVYQHQAQAQFRAVETGRYYLRAANTGISSVIAPDGSVLRRIAPLVDGYAVCEVGLRSGKTLYTIVGNLLVYLCIAFCVCVPSAGGFLKYRERRSKK